MKNFGGKGASILTNLAGCCEKSKQSAAGEFARVQVATLREPNAIVLPQRAIQDLQGKNYVWIVDADGKAQQHDVRMGPRIGENWLVQQGLKAGD